MEPDSPAPDACLDRTPLLIDCDTGIDDSLALLYAAASPECEIVAVTCTAGNVDLRQVAENTRAVLELAGRTDVEVAAGREQPLERPLKTTPETHGPRGLGYADLPPARTALSGRGSAELIVEEARRRPGKLTLVTLAPLTNVAVAVRLEPDLPRLLRGLVMMLGSYRSPGNTAPTTEWNAAVDPESVKVVLDAWTEAGVRPLALGLDVTERARLLPGHLAALAALVGCDVDGSTPAGPNRVVRFVADALRFYMEFHSRYDGFYGAFIHDPLALATALDRSLVEAVAVPVDVELAGSLTTGETVTDWRRVWRRPDNVEVAVAADSDRFMARFVERVGALATGAVGGT